jgi:hypothetical protein
MATKRMVGSSYLHLNRYCSIVCLLAIEGGVPHHWYNNLLQLTQKVVLASWKKVG